MAEPIKINTGKYRKSGSVEVDGHIWRVVLPGAGTELRFSQASRACKLNAARIDMLDKKIDNGTVTEAELDNYEEYSKRYEENEQIVYEIFQSTFRDNTEDNSEVKKWMDETPTAMIMLAFEDLKMQSSEAANGRTEQAAGA